MADDRDENIRQRAYALWESEGYPDGRHEEHWAEAKSEFDAGQTADIPPARKLAKPRAARAKAPTAAVEPTATAPATAPEETASIPTVAPKATAPIPEAAPKAAAEEMAV